MVYLHAVWLKFDDVVSGILEGMPSVTGCLKGCHHELYPDEENMKSTLRCWCVVRAELW